MALPKGISGMYLPGDRVLLLYMYAYVYAQNGARSAAPDRKGYWL